MKTPRDISGKDIIKALSVYGYQPTRQNGSHIRITTQQEGEHHLAITNHNPIKIGTLNSIISQGLQYIFLLQKNKCFKNVWVKYIRVNPCNSWQQNEQKLYKNWGSRSCWLRKNSFDRKIKQGYEQRLQHCRNHQ